MGAISVAAPDIVRFHQSHAAVPSGHSGRPDHGSMASQSDHVHDADIAGIRTGLLADTTGNNPVSEVRKSVAINSSETAGFSATTHGSGFTIPLPPISAPQRLDIQ